MTSREQIAEALRRSARVLLVNHIEPDGDSLGSTLALGNALEVLGIRAQVASDGGVPRTFRFLPGAERVVSEIAAGDRFDAAVAMECSTLDRCGRVAPAVARTPLIITIDHHQTAEPFGHLNDWEPTAAAVGEMVADLIDSLAVPLTPAIAIPLMTAIATDTGVFRFPNVRPHTLRLAARLLEHGASLHEIVTRVYDSLTPEANRLLGLALSKMVLALDGSVVYCVIDGEDLRAAGAEPDETAGIVSALRRMQGVKVALLFEPIAQGSKVSIRTRDGVRAHVIAEAFGGGGHRGAAGCRLAVSLGEAVRALLPAVEAELRIQTEPPVPA